MNKNKPPFLLLHLLFLLLPLLMFYFFSCILAQPSLHSSDTPRKTRVPFQLVSLLAVKSSLNDPLSTFNDWDLNKAGGSDNEPVWCLWSGVKCDAKSGQVTSLNLSRRNLSGLIPAEIRYLSSSLLHLNLSGNSFDGPFPSFIFELTKLRTLDISHNSFNSTFPPAISKLKFLRIFNAYSNSFNGPLPGDVMRLTALEELNLGGSYFEGEIPRGYGNLPRLRLLHLAGNVLTGALHKQLGFLNQLEHLEIGYNQFIGGIPQELSLLSNLKYLDVSNNKLSGSLTQELGNLSKLEALYLFNNRFSGEIPLSYTNLKALRVLDLSDNNLTGEIPEGFSELEELAWLSLISNNLTGTIPEGIGKLPNLTTLLLWNNRFTGNLPQNLGMNGKLLKLDVSSNSLSGPIPPGLCSGNKLFNLILFSNGFENEIPRNLTNCTSLWRLRIQDNRLNGSLPHGFGRLSNLTFVDLSKNRFTGEIPEDLGTSPALQYLNVSENSFESTLPENIWRAPNLQVFSASFSNLSGKIPDFVGCKSVYNIELQGNSFNGSIPWDIGHCEKLQSLNLGRNSLTGIIPWEITTLRSITTVDLSRNLLTGSIPSDFGNCKTLQNFNVSCNQLAGPIPTSGSMFPNLHPSSFSGNKGLCGDVVAKPCAAEMLAAAAADARQHHPQPRKTASAIAWIMAAAFAIGLFVLFAGTRCFHVVNHSRRFAEEPPENRPWKLTAFQRLNFTAEDLLQTLSATDTIIGMGSTGAVYRAEMPTGETIAVKKLWGKHKEHKIRRRKGVLAEVEVLGNVRHRNIVRLLGYCSNGESTMLLYEYMPNGNLDDLLHRKSKGETANAAADWTARYKIVLGVAQGICYLHHDCDPVIVHRDLKPSNILLDGEFEARVADFGVAKLIQTNESMSIIAGSYGYIAPEYAYTLQVNQKCDIYSFGVVLMEIISGKRSVEPEFGDGNSIVDWIKSKIRTREGIGEIFDKNAGAECAVVREEMKQILRIALLCTSANPVDRPSMRDVVLMLQEAEPKRKQPVYNGGGGGGGGRYGSGGSGLARGDDDCFESSIIPKFAN